MSEQDFARVREEIWHSDGLLALARIEQRLAELEKERDLARLVVPANQYEIASLKARAETAESRLAAYERVVNAAAETIRQIQKANGEIADAAESYEAIEGLCRDALAALEEALK